MRGSKEWQRLTDPFADSVVLDLHFDGDFVDLAGHTVAGQGVTFSGNAASFNGTNSSVAASPSAD